MTNGADGGLRKRRLIQKMQREGRHWFDGKTRKATNIAEQESTRTFQNLYKHSLEFHHFILIFYISLPGVTWLVLRKRLKL